METSRTTTVSFTLALKKLMVDVMDTMFMLYTVYGCNTKLKVVKKDTTKCPVPNFYMTQMFFL